MPFGSPSPLPQWETLPEPAASTSSPGSSVRQEDSEEEEVRRATLIPASRKRKLQERNEDRCQDSAAAGPSRGALASPSSLRGSVRTEYENNLVAAINASSASNRVSPSSPSPSAPPRTQPVASGSNTTPASASALVRPATSILNRPRGSVQIMRVKRTDQEKARQRSSSPESDTRRGATPSKRPRIDPSSSSSSTTAAKKRAGEKGKEKTGGARKEISASTGSGLVGKKKKGKEKSVNVGRVGEVERWNAANPPDPPSAKEKRPCSTQSSSAALSLPMGLPATPRTGSTYKPPSQNTQVASASARALPPKKTHLPSTQPSSIQSSTKNYKPKSKTQSSSTSKSKSKGDQEIIEISDSDDEPPPPPASASWKRVGTLLDKTKTVPDVIDLCSGDEVSAPAPPAAVPPPKTSSEPKGKGRANNTADLPIVVDSDSDRPSSPPPVSTQAACNSIATARPSARISPPTIRNASVCDDEGDTEPATAFEPAVEPDHHENEWEDMDMHDDTQVPHLVVQEPRPFVVQTPRFSAPTIPEAAAIRTSQSPIQSVELSVRHSSEPEDIDMEDELENHESGREDDISAQNEAVPLEPANPPAADNNSTIPDKSQTGLPPVSNDSLEEDVSPIQPAMNDERGTPPSQSASLATERGFFSSAAEDSPLIPLKRVPSVLSRAPQRESQDDVSVFRAPLRAESTSLASRVLGSKRSMEGTMAPASQAEEESQVSPESPAVHASPTPLVSQLSITTKSPFIDLNNPPKHKSTSPSTSKGQDKSLRAMSPSASPVKAKYIDLHNVRTLRKQGSLSSLERRRTLNIPGSPFSQRPESLRQSSLSSSSSGEQSENKTKTPPAPIASTSSPVQDVFKTPPIRSPIAPQLGAQTSPTRFASATQANQSLNLQRAATFFGESSNVSSRPLQFISRKKPPSRASTMPNDGIQGREEILDSQARKDILLSAQSKRMLRSLQEPTSPSSPSAGLNQAALTFASQAPRSPTTAVPDMALSPAASPAKRQSLNLSASASSPVLPPASSPTRFVSSPPVSSPEPEGVHLSHEVNEVAGTPEVEAVSSQIDQKLSLDPGPKQAAVDVEDGMDIDGATAPSRRRNEEEDGIVPESPQPERDDDDSSSILEYAPDPHPPIYIPDPVDLPAAPSAALSTAPPAAASVTVEVPDVVDAVPSPTSELGTPASEDSILDDSGLDDSEKEERLFKRTRHLSEQSEQSMAFTGPPSNYHSEPSVTPEEEPPCRRAAPVQLLNFQQYRRDYRLPIRFARDLPHSVQDYVNCLPQGYRNRHGLRVCFEAMIAENTADDEPNAPKIRLINNVDDESTPLWEFHYSNHMWLGEGVPIPDVKKLKGCDCIGGCNPKSTSCSCLRRQKELYTDDTYSDFAYDKTGKLLYNHDHYPYPIFECNEMCGCDETCRNRVVQNGRKHEVNIVKTPNKGWGVFAGDQAKIPKGSFIGIYAGEVIKDDEADRRGVVYNNKSGRTYLFDLDSYHLKYVTADGELQNKAEREATDEREKVEEWCSTYSIDAFHAGNFTRYVNHSCQPNCELWSVYLNNPNLNLPLLVFFTIRDIHPREELTFDYSGDAIHEEGQKPKHLNDNKCYCGAPQCKGYMFR